MSHIFISTIKQTHTHTYTYIHVLLCKKKGKKNIILLNNIFLSN